MRLTNPGALRASRESWRGSLAWELAVGTADACVDAGRDHTKFYITGLSRWRSGIAAGIIIGRQTSTSLDKALTSSFAVELETCGAGRGFSIGARVEGALFNSRWIDAGRAGRKSKTDPWGKHSQKRGRSHDVAKVRYVYLMKEVESEWRIWYL